MPTCTIYDYLEGRIPNPVHAYRKIADITEADEKGRINREIGERRTRLGANIDQVIRDVKREVFQNSELESLYNNIINWTDDHETRRQYEEKLIQHTYDTLSVSEKSRKTQLRELVLGVAQGLVILKHPFALAWKIVLEWKDVKELCDLDCGLLIEYITHFPEDGLSKVLRGYLECEICPFPKTPSTPGEAKEDKDENFPMGPEDRLLLMIEGMDESSSSILSHRVTGEYILYLSDYENAVTISRQAQKNLRIERNVSGLSLSNSSDAIDIILATALVQYESPRNHPEAKSIFENVLLHRPTHTSALIGVGLILEEQDDYLEAVDFFNRALERAPDVKIKAEVAWCKVLMGDYDTSLYELEACLPEMQGSGSKTKTLKSQTLYRIGICLWERDKAKSARKDRKGAYARFLSSVQIDVNNAPAYTSLGVYYADYAKDQKRARKCFQKAFELSASEVGAAERLAKSFAKTREWDLVEAVAQRVIDSGRLSAAPGSKMKGVSWPFSALGVVQLNKQDYFKSIVSFQSALRSLPEDFHSWLGLGESYQKSGRYIAATRAFEQAQKLAHRTGKDNADAEHLWFCNYMLANVKRELGDFESALTGYREVLNARPMEFGVSVALLQTLIESSWQSIELGFYGRSVTLATEAISVASKVLELRKDAFDLWKSLGDACSVFSRVQAHAKELPIGKVRAILESDVEPDEYEVISDLDGVGIFILSTDDEEISLLDLCFYAAILANKRSIRVSDDDVHARSIAWYNLGWAEYQAYRFNLKETKSATGKKPLRFLRASVQCFKRAIELESGNSEFWNSLGIVTATLNPKVSQHSFVRSLYLNERSARVWTNLGTLYLAQKDHELANAAFARAQSTDPAHAQAWLGQGMLADRLGETREAYTLFTHAFETAVSSSTLIKQQYALSAFDHLLSQPQTANVTDVLQPRLALHQLLCQHPTDLAFQHLSSLFAERAGDFSSAVQDLEKICLALEVEYEASESPITLGQFLQAKSELGRVQFAERDFVSAAENAETALDLSADEDPRSAAQEKQRLSAHITAGLAYYHQGSMESAISKFRGALEETQGDPDIICFLAKLLWSKGGSDEREVAREQLLDCVEKFPGHFDATTLLCAIAIFEDDRDIVEAVSEEVQSLRTCDKLTLEQQRQINQLLAAIAALYPGQEGEESKMAAAATTVMFSPSQPQGWSQLAEISNEAYPTEMVVLMAAKAVPPGGSLGAKDLCTAYACTGRLDDAQRAVMVAPWMPQGWKAFF